MSKYVDTPSIIQVIGGIYTNPSLLDMEDKYTFYEEDFPEEFHKILFGSIFNLHQLGAKDITPAVIEDYLEQRPKKYAVYKINKGSEYLQNLVDSVQITAFDYYYQKMKKMTLLRMYQSIGMDLKWLYDIDNILDLKKKQKQEEWLDNTPIDEIADLIDKKITDIRLKYVDNSDDDFCQAGEGIKDLIQRLKDTPEIGYPLYGSLVNTIHRGARLKKFYLRSAATGVGKTRAMIADVCNIACDEIYDINKRDWILNGTKEPALFIGTEQDEEEIQTMMLAFLSAVNEEHILTGEYGEGEEERVLKAADLIEKSPLYIKKLPDFSLQDIENCIKYAIREWGVRYIFFDYIHSSLKILSEISSKAGVKNLREDNILFMISVRLKDLCNEYGVFIMTATQLNSDYQTSSTPDQNLLRGAKSIADKIDVGMIMLQTTPDDEKALETVLGSDIPMPEIKISVYKNRRGRWKNVLLWCRADRGTCRIEPIFMTDFQYKLIEIEDLKINVNPKIQASAF